jgi:hypothetical protein
MTNTYDGAVAAIREKARAAWSTTLLAVENETPPANPWPPIDPSTGNPAPWAFLEIEGTNGLPHAFGLPGSQLYRYDGLIRAYAYVPVNDGSDTARQYAVALAEIFRNQNFYNDGAGSYVWSQWPGPARIIGNDAGQGNAWGVSVTIPFLFYFRG